MMTVLPLRYIAYVGIGILVVLGIADACNLDWAVTDIFNKAAETVAEETA